MRFVTEAGNCELKLAPKLIKGRKRQVAFSIDDLPDESIEMVMAGKQASDAVLRRFAYVRQGVVCV